MESKPAVSVIIPVYNAANHLQECLDSVINQTLRNIEIICIDDGSTDNSSELLQQYEVRDSRVLILSQENCGSGPARNNGILSANGEFIAFMDADDYYPENTTLEKLFHAAKEHHVLVCGGSFSTLCVDGSIKMIYDPEMYWGYTFSHDEKMEYADYQFDYGYHRFIYNRMFLLENSLFFPSYLRFQDPPFFVKTMITAKSFYAIHDITYRYRKSPGYLMISASKQKTKDSILGYTDTLCLAKKNQLNRLYHLTLARCYKENWNILKAAESFHDPDINEALKSFNEAIDLALWNPDIGYLYKIQYIRDRTYPPNTPQTSALKKEITDIRNSVSYRIGRFITWIPRKIRCSMNCYKEHGFAYTLRRMFEKMKGN